MKDKKLSEFIKENSFLFWWIPDDRKQDISVESLVEHILNYGDENSVKKLFDLMGTEKAAEIFSRQTAGPRCNYFPQVINFFNLYFQRYVQKYPF
ncbi:MAG: hypothetical protein AB7S75_10780 [Desulfococcaceae bacterium]